MTAISNILDNSGEITDSVNDIPAAFALPDTIETLDREVLIADNTELRELVTNLSKICLQKNRQIRAQCEEMVRMDENIAFLRKTLAMIGRGEIEAKGGGSANTAG